MIISSSIHLKMRNISDKSCRENQNTFYVQLLFFPENGAFCEIMWKNIVEPASAQMTMARAYCMPNG